VFLKAVYDPENPSNCFHSAYILDEFYETESICFEVPENKGIGIH
jgi:hypothetical protein